MADGYTEKNDRAPLYGMNNRDDPKAIKDGEVPVLANAEPGNPPVARRGCRHWKIADSEDYVYASHFVSFITTGGSIYLVGWIKDGTDYKLIKINYNTKVMSVLGTATDLASPAFRIVKVFDYIYSIIDENMHWKGSGFISRHKIIELFDTGPDVVREMCIDTIAALDSVSVITGTNFGAGFVGYSITFVRHTANDAFDSNGNSQILDSFTPGVLESVENSSGRLVVGATTAFSTILNLLHSGTNTTYEQAKEFGATHLRIYRTRLKTTEEIATTSLKALEGYFLVDLPIAAHLPSRPIADIILASNNYKMTISGHGLSAGNVLFFGFDNIELDGQVWPITIDDVDTIQLTSSWEKIWDEYSGSGGYLSDTYLSISSIDLSYDKILVIFNNAHSLSPSDPVYIDDITGGDGGGGEDYIFASVWQGTSGKYVYRTAAAHIGLNGSNYTVDSVFSAYGVYLDVSPDDYLKQFIAPTQDELDALYVEYPSLYPVAYTYSDADKTPTMADGYVGGDLQAVTAMSSPDNEVIVETVGVHNLTDDLYVKLDGLTGATELEDYSGLIEIINTIRFKLVGKSTSGISAYISGGEIIPSTSPLAWTDTVSDATLAGELASMVTNGYSVGPKAGLVEYANGRMWLFSLLTEEKGRAYYSEILSGAGGTPLDEAVQYPQKFASLFRFNYYIDFSVQKGQVATGIKRMFNDIYFFFEGEVHALFTGDPVIAEPTLINSIIGCAFPDTLVTAEIPFYGGQCLIYISNLGPAITRQGGETFLFTDFKIGELWPKKNKELFNDLVDNRDTIINNCSGVFWKNTYFITYYTAAGIKKIFAYYFNPELLLDSKAPHGPYRIDLAEVS